MGISDFRPPEVGSDENGTQESFRSIRVGG
jgi:hypothetical protein